MTFNYLKEKSRMNRPSTIYDLELETKVLVNVLKFEEVSYFLE